MIQGAGMNAFTGANSVSFKQDDPEAAKSPQFQRAQEIIKDTDQAMDAFKKWDQGALDGDLKYGGDWNHKYGEVEIRDFDVIKGRGKFKGTESYDTKAEGKPVKTFNATEVIDAGANKKKEMGYANTGRDQIYIRHEITGEQRTNEAVFVNNETGTISIISDAELS